jgi:allantoinase
MSSTIDVLVGDARVHLPGGAVTEGWLAVADGRVAAVGSGPAPTATTLIDAGGRDVIPGVVDTHTHFRDPGDTHKEDFSTGTLAAAFGGVTTVVDMPNTGHMVVTPEDFVEKRDHVAGRSWVDFGLHATFLDSGPHVRELAALGCAGLKWMLGYGEWKGLPCQPSSYAEARATLMVAAAVDLLVSVHAESLPWLRDLSAMLRAAGRSDVAAHGDSRPPFVEAISVAEATIAAAEYGCRLHIVHLTSEVPLRTAIALRDALGARLTFETCPSYLFLTHDDVEAQGVGIQVNPPMRSAADQVVMWEAIRNGEIYSVASDHAPTVPADKVRENPMDALPGVLAVETMLPLLLDATAAGKVTFARVVELLCEHPASLVRLGHRKGALLPGYDADFVLVDMEARTTVRGEALHSKQRFTPYEGRELQGAIDTVFVRGRPVVLEGKLAAESPFGVHVPSLSDAADRAALEAVA